jgi:fucose 4-O-acetylase-like acetyltransferase
LRAERLSWIDVLKGIGIVLVVIGHIYSNRSDILSICRCSFLQQDGYIKKKLF